MENNIFTFATSELSQDAFISWCLNWINYPEKPLYALAEQLLLKMGEDKDSFRDGIIIERQIKHVDVLVVIKGKNRAIIIEDKVYTSEHSNQIARYEKEIRSLPDDWKHGLGITNDVEIRTVYLKTGHMYDYDEMVKADVKINGPDFLSMLMPYNGQGEIIDSFIEFLESRIQWYKDHGDFRNVEDVKYQTIAQTNLMRAIFPRKKWDGESDLYKVYDGTNMSGTPWTEMVILNEQVKDMVGFGDGDFSVFWRIDHDSAGVYVSLRLYDPYDSKNQGEMDSHMALYDKVREITNTLLEEHEKEFSFDLKDVKCGYTAKYKEAAVFHWHIEEVLKNWDSTGKIFIDQINKVTEYFLEAMEEEKRNDL